MLRVPQILKERRLQKKLSLEDVSKATKIKVHFLDAIERGAYNELPSSSYAQGFVHNYAIYLKFSERKIMPLFRREFDTKAEFNVLPGGLPKKDSFPLKQFRFGRGTWLVLFVFLLLFFYILFQYRFAFINPPLTVSSPVEGSTVVAAELPVVGKTDPNTTVYVDNNAVSVDQSGSFKKTIDLFLGPATIKIRSVNKFGRQTEIDRHISVQSQ